MKKDREKGLNKGNESTQFSKSNQPTPEQKSNGHAKKALLKQISEQLLSGDSADDMSVLAKYLGIDVNAIDIETAMHLKQIELAIIEGDTKAYSAVMDRIKGKPLQAIEVKETHDVRPKFLFMNKK